MLEDLFVNKSIVKVIDFVLDEPELDFSKAEVAREVKLTWKSVDSVFDLLVKFDIVKPTRRVNKSNMFSVKKDSEIFKSLKRLDIEVSSKINEEIAEKELRQEKIRHSSQLTDTFHNHSSIERLKGMTQMI